MLSRLCYDRVCLDIQYALKFDLNFPFPLVKKFMRTYLSWLRIFSHILTNAIVSTQDKKSLFLPMLFSSNSFLLRKAVLFSDSALFCSSSQL